MAEMDKTILREIRRQKSPSVTAFSSRISVLSSPLGLPKEFAQMEQQLKEIHPKEDSIFYYHSSES